MNEVQKESTNLHNSNCPGESVELLDVAKIHVATAKPS